MTSRIAVAVCLVSLLTAPAARADVIEIGVVANGADFATFNEAVSAANDGDTLLVTHAGPYAESLTLDARSLTLAVDDGVAALLIGTLEIRNVGASQQLVISGLAVRGNGAQAYAVRVSDSAGPVLLQNCDLQGLPNFDCTTYGEGFQGFGQTALVVRNSSRVIVQESLLSGGQGAGGVVDAPCYVGGRGGHGVEASASGLQLIECVVTGGRGGTNINGESLGGDGGAGVAITGLQLITQAGTITGGEGGQGVDFFPIEGFGNGGPGVHAMGANHARLFDTALVGGAAGWSSLGIPGDEGAPSIQEGATFFEIPVDVSTTSTSDRVAREGEVLGVTITGTPGDLLLVFGDTQLAPSYLQNYYGTLMTPLPAAIGPLTLGVIPGSGVRNLALPIPELGLDALPLVFQPVLLGGPGQIQVSTSRTVLLLDAGL